MTVENFVLESYGQLLRKLKFSSKGREKKIKRHEWISSRTYFPTPKKGHDSELLSSKNISSADVPRSTFSIRKVDRSNLNTSF